MRTCTNPPKPLFCLRTLSLCRTLALALRLSRKTQTAFASPLLLALLCLVLVGPAAAAHASEGTSPDVTTTKAATTAIHPVVAERLLRANDYLEKNRLDDALSVVDEVARMRKLKPMDLAQIHRFRGYILLAKGDSAEAGKEFEAALAAGVLEESARQGMLYSLAQIYTQAEKFERARELIDNWFATEPDPKAEAFFLKAMILVQQEAFQDALAPARTAIEKSPQVRESWLQLLAAIEFQLQDYPALADTLRRLVAASPGTKRYWVQLATIENSIGKEDSALATLGIAQAGGLLSEDKEYRQRARLCFVRDLPHCCTSTIEEGMAAGIVKPDAESYRLLASCYIASRETDKALGPLAKAGELGSDEKGFLLLGQLELQKDRFDAARDSLVKARQRATPEKRGSIELLIGIAELGSNRFDSAERSFRIAQADAKTRPAAESYLKHLEQKRAMLRLQHPALAQERDGSPVSSSAAASANEPM